MLFRSDLSLADLSLADLSLADLSLADLSLADFLLANLDSPHSSLFNVCLQATSWDTNDAANATTTSSTTHQHDAKVNVIRSNH